MNKIIDIDKIKILLENKALRSGTIENETGVDKKTIENIRSGKVSIENISVHDALKLSEFCDSMCISYDYTELLQELKEDLANSSATLIAIVREDRKIYKPIIDYFLPQNFSEIDEPCEVVYIKDVIKEMQEMNSLIG